LHPLHSTPRRLYAALFGVFGIHAAAAHAAGLAATSEAPVAAAVQPAPAVMLAAARNVNDQLDPVTVTATRVATPASRTAASVSVITSDDIEEQQANDIKDALRYEPGVSVPRAPYRPSSAAQGGGRDSDSSINIRGLEGNRILLMEDGIRLPSAFSFGPLEAGRGDYADMETLKRIEILRGPASALYGSDGLTGAVNFITKDPQDLLDIYGKKTYFSLRPSYASADRSVGGTVSAAAGNDVVQGMIIADGRRGHEIDTMGSNNSTSTLRTTANPQDTYTESLLGKLVFTPTARDTLKFTAETVQQRIDTNVLSAVNPPTTLGLTDNNKLERNRYSFDYDFADRSNRYLQAAHLQLYYQDSYQDQFSNEIRGTSLSRTRANTYSENVFGGSAFAESAFTTGPLAHKLIYGVDGSLDRVKNLRNGTVPGVGEPPFPNKAFPDTDYTLMGAFVQDEIGYGKLTVTPGLRFDAYRLSPRTGDPLYAGNPVSTSDNALSPRLAVLYQISPALTPYAQYAHGFRTPTPDQVNNSFANPIYGYTSIGNPNLKPETSDTIEAGLRGKLDTGYGALRYSTALFGGNYHDFITQRTVSGAGTPSNPLVYQYVNFATARIYGLEGRAEWVMPNGITLKTAMAYTKGTMQNEGEPSQPLNTVNPFSAVLGVRFEPSERWFVQGDLLFQLAKSESDIASGTCLNARRQAISCFAPPSSFVVDLRGGYHFTKHVVGYVGVFNLFDRKYWNWSDVRGIAQSSPVLDAYTAPGRNVSVSMKVDF
jgi:hemoglobin/transferrin/lactoferrin receptor protein